uniref:Upstream transcription factor family member 3 n=1 Tax=Pyxicephalus adspersus TaxID=30357 RepID=A0AAV3B383_PYXAD|nr:TPA: hypothetical protein GDO54_002149 [Pyxicephalus adspersus]
MVQMPSCQPVTVTPFKTLPQPQSTTNILPLNQPMQVIQVAQPFGAALNPAPANQNIILLQPPAPAPCPTLPKPAVGQQIVIIQAAPNQNPIPLMSAQPSPSVVMPMNTANPVVCPANTVQSIVAPQTLGAKHLVHILPRPAPAQPSGSTQQVSASPGNSNQQPPTISLNGQLFALQPVTPSAGSTSQTPMQIIQPTTSEDPNTNVALNTFGALATLSQSISQIGGQNCVQLTLNPSVATSLAGNTLPVNCAPVPVSSVTTVTAETSVVPVASVLTKPFSVKTVGGTPTTAKPKKSIKKPTVKKGGPLKKETTPTVTLDGSSEGSKSQSPSDEPNQMEKLSAVVTAPNATQEKTSVTDDISQNIDRNQDMTGAEDCSSVALGMEGSILSESVLHDPAEFSAPRDFVAEEVCVNQNERNQPSITPASPKAEVVAATLPLKEQSVQDSLQVDHLQDQSVVTIDEHSNAASKECLIQGDTADLTAADLLEVQILSEDPNIRPPEKGSTDVPNSSRTLYSEAKSNNALTAASTDSVMLTTSVVHIAQSQSSTSEHEVVNSCANSRQTDSPMSNSSVSGRNFTVASMLPDTSRTDTTNPISSVPPFNGCSFPEPSEIVATATRTIFNQENIAKDRTRMQTEVVETVSKNTEVVLPENCHLPFKPHLVKEGISQLPSISHSFSTSASNVPSTTDQLVDKSHCTLGLNSTNLSLQISTSQSQSVTSLSINNLIHQRGITHSVSTSASASQASERLCLATSANSSVPTSSYGSHSAGTMVLSEYHQDELHSVKSAVMQVPQTTDSLLKQNLDVRKESSKRTAHGDELLSTAKRQKPCQGPLRMERIQTSDSVSEQNEMLVGQIPSISTSLSGSIQGHGEGISSLFPASNNFVTPNLRQSDMRCNSQPSIPEQSQMGNQHLQSLQQHQQVTLVHNNPYIKQQQTGHMREQHHLYQQQQQQQHHHVSLADSSVRAQSHNVQQQRMIQQDVQMQKKRPPIQQKQLPEQNRQNSAQTHPHHQQMQQQMQSHFGSTQTEKSCENNASARGLHSSHQQSHMSQDILHQHQQDINNRAQGSVVSSDHLPGLNQVQRLMTSRSLEQQLVSQPSVVSRNTNMNMSTSHRQERNRVSSYSAEALIGKSTSNSEQRIEISVQTSRVSEQMEMRKYLDASRNKVMSSHNIQSRMTIEHSVNTDSQRHNECQTFKPSGLNQQQPPSTFEVQTSRNNDGGTQANMRSLQSQTYRINQNSNSAMDRQKHLPYQTVQEIPVPNTLPIRDNENSCHQSFMQSLLAPHIGEQVVSSQRAISGPQRPQYNSSSSIEFGCPPSRDSLHLRRDSEIQNRESCELVMGQVPSRNSSLNIPFSSSSTSGDIQGRNTSPHSTVQKSNSIRQVDSQGAKNQLNIQVSINMHGVVHPPLSHQSVSHGNLDQRQTVRQTNPPVPQRSRHPIQEEPETKTRQPDRSRTGSQRHSNMFDPALPHLPLAGPSSMILGRQQPVMEKRPGIVRFMSDTPQVPTDNSGPDQHTLTQNFAFPFIPEGTMNPPINANASFIPPVTQATATRTPALIPVDPQNTLPSFYPPYSPAHPSLSNDLTLPYFPNQMFPNPSTEKTNSSGLNNRFGSILSPPRPVGFSQTTFPLLPEMPPMHMANPSHLSNFNLTSLFPEIATALPPDGSAMSPLLSISHPSTSDSSKQTSNRPAHNISHILGHDSSSAV